MRGTRSPRGLSHRSKDSIAGVNYAGDAAGVVAPWGGGPAGVSTPTVGIGPTITLPIDADDNGTDKVTSKQSTGGRRIAANSTKSRLRTQLKSLANFITFCMETLAGTRTAKGLALDAAGGTGGVVTPPGSINATGGGVFGGAVAAHGNVSSDAVVAAGTNVTAGADMTAVGNVLAGAAVAGSEALFDGAGGLSGTAAPSGAVTVTSTAATGNAAPTPAFHKGTVYKDTALLAWGVVSGGVLVSGVNVASIVHAGTGVYNVTLNVGASATNKLCPMANAAGENIVAATQATAANAFTVITSHGEVAPSAGRIDMDFFFQVYGG